MTIIINAITAEKGRAIDGKVYSPGVHYQELRAADQNPGPDEIYKRHSAHGDNFTIQILHQAIRPIWRVSSAG